MVGLKCVAKHAGVAPSHVSNFFNHPERVSQEARRRIAQSIQELGYVRNLAASDLRASKNRILALVVLEAWIPFFAELARGFEDAAIEQSYTCVFLNSARIAEREKAHLEFIATRRIQGAAVVPHSDVSKQLHAFRKQGLGAVVLDTPEFGKSLPTIYVDDEEGGRIAARHALSYNSTSAAFVGRNPDIHHAMDRLRGFKEVLLPSGIEVIEISCDQLDMASGVRAGEQLLIRETLPHTLFAANDLIALGLLQTCLKAGVNVPNEVAIIGYDGSIYAAQAAVPLTTVQQPAYEMGAMAANLLIQEIHSPSTSNYSKKLTPQLVVRASTPEIGKL